MSGRPENRSLAGRLSDCHAVSRYVIDLSAVIYLDAHHPCGPGRLEQPRSYRQVVHEPSIGFAPILPGYKAGVRLSTLTRLVRFYAHGIMRSNASWVTPRCTASVLCTANSTKAGQTGLEPAPVVLETTILPTKLLSCKAWSCVVNQHGVFSHSLTAALWVFGTPVHTLRWWGTLWAVLYT